MLRLFAVILPTGNISSELAEDSFCISRDTMSEDISFIHLADNSITPNTLPPPGFVAWSLIDLINLGVAYAVGSVETHAVPL